MGLRGPGAKPKPWFRQMTPAERAVLDIIRDGEEITVKAMAAQLDTSIRTIINCRERLERDGFIKRVSVAGGPGRPARYAAVEGRE